jgi:hypothetical protein
MSIHPDEFGLDTMVHAAISTATRLGYRLSYKGEPHISQNNRDYGGLPVSRVYGAKHSQMLTFEKQNSLVQISLCAGRQIWDKYTLQQYEPEPASVGVYASHSGLRERTTIVDAADVEFFIQEKLMEC